MPLPPLGICASGPQLSALALSGADYIEEHVQQFLVPEMAEDEFLARLKALPAKPPVRAANCFLPGDLKVVGPTADLSRLAKYAGSAFRRAKQAGIRTIVFGSAGARAIPQGFDRQRAKEQFIEALKAIAPLAAEQGVTVVVEPLNTLECNFINSLDEGAELVLGCGQASVRLLCDIYHMKMENEGPEAILRQGPLLRHAHVAEKEGRAFPGRHGEDLRPYLRALKKVDYQGAISLECGWTALEKEAPGALRDLRKQLEEAGF